MIPSSRAEYARQFAAEVHAGQLYGDQPYTVHTDAVAAILKRYGFSDDVIAAGHLRDVLEDCKVTEGEIAWKFGARVAAIVAGVTDEPGANRRERKAKTYPKIRLDSDCVAVKLADRIANVAASLKAPNRLREMYRREHGEFRAALWREDEHVGMWAELDALIMKGTE